MMNFLFKISMYILAVLVVSGFIAFAAWQLAKILAILAILSPFGAIIVWKINKKINTAPIKGEYHGTQSRKRC